MELCRNSRWQQSYFKHLLSQNIADDFLFKVLPHPRWGESPAANHRSILINIPLGLLINFGAPTFKDGRQRIVNDPQSFAYRARLASIRVGRRLRGRRSAHFAVNNLSSFPYCQCGVAPFGLKSQALALGGLHRLVPICVICGLFWLFWKIAGWRLPGHPGASLMIKMVENETDPFLSSVVSVRKRRLSFYQNPFQFVFIGFQGGNLGIPGLKLAIQFLI
jgi:hypothetical protein